MRILVMGVSVLAAVAAQAQTRACDQLKGELAARIDASGARGYALETVPSGTPVPPGAKAIGTCEAGKYKVLYLRWAAASSAAAAARAPEPVSAASTPVTTSVAQASGAPDGPSEVGAARASDPVVAQVAPVQPAPAPPADNAFAKTSLARRAVGFLVEHWPWFLALALLPLGAWLWSWLAYRRAYDAAGLPRGPKL